MRLLAITAALAAALTSPAFAQGATAGGSGGAWYAGGGYTHYDLDQGNVGGVTGRLGYQFTPNIGAEAEATFGVQDDDNIELNHAWGVYGVGTLPVTENLNVFARAGWQQLDADGKNGFPDLSDEGAGYGAGVNWRMNNGFAIRGDYTRLDGDEDADTWSLSGVMSF